MEAIACAVLYKHESHCGKHNSSAASIASVCAPKRASIQNSYSSYDSVLGFNRFNAMPYRELFRFLDLKHLNRVLLKLQPNAKPVLS